ncbi:MAG: ACP S-malonyltransferase [Candidatus Aminicenantes bacterium]|jgi:[acyl-carrier-protein] S-malonyltransferase
MKKIAVLFPGQGVQYTGMAEELYRQNKLVREIFTEANDVLGYDLKRICFAGDNRELNRTENAQPAILVAAFAAFQVHIQEANIIPHYMCGHSLGEYTALTCSGAIRFQDVLKIVRKRGLLMQKAVARGEGAMAAVNGVDLNLLEEEVTKESAPGHMVSIAAFNPRNQYVISGHKAAVAKLEQRLSKKGIHIIPLNVSAPFHSPLMKTAVDELREELSAYSFSQPGCQVISNLNGRPYQTIEEMIEGLVNQLYLPIRWSRSMEYLLEQNVYWFIDTGPKKRMGNLLKDYPDKIEVFALDDLEQVEGLQNSLKKNIKFLTTLITRSLALAVSVPNRSRDEDEYAEGVLVPYRRIKAIQGKIESEERLPGIHEMKQVLALLNSIFRTKQVGEKEKKLRLLELLEETGTHHRLKC